MYDLTLSNEQFYALKEVIQCVNLYFYNLGSEAEEPFCDILTDRRSHALFISIDDKLSEGPTEGYSKGDPSEYEVLHGIMKGDIPQRWRTRDDKPETPGTYVGIATQCKDLPFEAKWNGEYWNWPVTFWTEIPR